LFIRDRFYRVFFIINSVRSRSIPAISYFKKYNIVSVVDTSAVGIRQRYKVRPSGINGQ
jgi:hypothetical protein